MPSRKRQIVVRIRMFVPAFAVLAGCAEVPDGGTEAELADSLLSATISGIYDKPITLQEGRYEGEPFVAGGASRPSVMLLPEPRVRSDIDGDGNPEWLVVLAESSGGSGTFLYLAVVKEDGGRFRSIATAFLGDRVRVERLSAEGAAVRVDLLAPGSADYSCCPIGLQSMRWQWYDDRLQPVSRIAGNLVYGHEAREFETCDGRQYWVTDATDGELQQFYEASIGRAYQPRFVEVMAIRHPAPDAVFAGPYEQQLRITELLRLETEGPGCSLDLGSAIVRASGVEPFWHLDVLSGSLRLARPGQAPRTFAVSAIESNTDASAGFWQAESDGDTVTLVLREARCTDAMSGSRFAYTAEVSLAGDSLSGCALMPLPRADE